jgi:pyruvate dehydrogenase E1 component beta subunit
MSIPGLKLMAPATPYDAKGMLKAAIRDDDPVISFEDGTVWSLRSEVPEDDLVIPLGQADVKRSGTDVTIVAVAGAVRHALDAAEQLAADSVSAEVVDLRSIVPMDRATILASVAKTGRLVVADPAHEMGSVASEVAAVVAQEGFDTLRGPIVRVTTPHTHIPFSAALEKPLYPNAEKIATAARRLLD